MVWCTIALPIVKRSDCSVSESCISLGQIHGVNRHDVICFPERLDDDIAEDNPVRVIDAFVDDLDVVACGFQRAGPATTGRPGYAPGALLKLYLDGALSR